MVEFARKELVVLKEEFRDQNIRRIYEVLEVDHTMMKVKVVASHVVSQKEETKDPEMGRLFCIEKDYFEKYM